MPLPREEARTPTAIGRIDWRIEDHPDGTQAIVAEIEVLDQDGDRMARRSVVLLPRGADADHEASELSTPQLNALRGVFTAVRQRAETEMLEPPA